VVSPRPVEGSWGGRAFRRRRGFELLLALGFLLLLMFADALLDLFLIRLGVAKGLAPQAVQQHQFRGLPHILFGDFVPVMIGGQGLGHLEHVDVGPVAVHPLVQADVGDEQQDVAVVAHLREPGPSRQDGLAQVLLFPFPALVEAHGVLLVIQTALHHGYPALGIVETGHLHAEAEAIQELGPKFSFLGVHGAHQDEAGRMGEGNALPLHHIHPHGRRVQEHFHQVVVQEVYFIHIQDAPMGRGHDAGLEMLFPLFDGLFQINGAQQSILGGAQGQVHHRHGFEAAGQGLPALPALPASGAHEVFLLGVAIEGAVGHHLDGWQKLRQAPGGAGFGGAFLSPDQDPAQPGIDGVQNQGLFQQVLAHQGRKR